MLENKLPLKAVFQSVILLSEDEGNVGVYYKYGAMLKAHSMPGMHMKDPVATSLVVSILF